MNIEDPTPQIAAAFARWQRNRAFLSGEDAVKALKTQFLPQLPGQSDDEYKKYLFRVPFFAGAARIKDGLKGLIFRKPPVLDLDNAPSLEPIFDVITPAGHNWNDLCEDVVDETLITGFTGLLVDYPAQNSGLTLATAISSGHRPYIAVYQAEAIIEVSAAVFNGQQKIYRVRLLDNDDTVRELILDDSAGPLIYKQIIHRRNAAGAYIPDDEFIPTKNGKPLDTIPFVLVGEKPRHCNPFKAPLDDVVQSNLHTYLEGADAKNSRFYSSAPILCIMGAERIDSLSISPATVLQFPDSCQEKPVQVKFAEFQGHGQDALEKAYQNCKEEMALLGLRMLASDPKGVEAADTVAIRRASENSILAALARRVSDRLQEAANWVAWWLDAGEVTVNLNTDFLPESMTAQEMTLWVNTIGLGVFSRETVWNAFVDGGKLPEDFDPEAEKARIDAESLAVDAPHTAVTDRSVTEPPAPAPPAKG